MLVLLVFPLSVCEWIVIGSRFIPSVFYLYVISWCEGAFLSCTLWMTSSSSVLQEDTFFYTRHFPPFVVVFVRIFKWSEVDVNDCCLGLPGCSKWAHCHCALLVYLLLTTSMCHTTVFQCVILPLGLENKLNLLNRPRDKILCFTILFLFGEFYLKGRVTVCI